MLSFGLGSQSGLSALAARPVQLQLTALGRLQSLAVGSVKMHAYSMSPGGAFGGATFHSWPLIVFGFGASMPLFACGGASVVPVIGSVPVRGTVDSTM